MTDLPSVPWNAGWSSEERFEVRPCRYAGGRLALWQRHARGVGAPIFAKPHSVRQRRSIAEMRCTVCGEPTVADDQWWFGLGTKLGAQFATTEAPVHEACAHHAHRVCPHLRSLGREPEPMPGGYGITASIVGGAAFEREFGVRVNGRTIIGSLKLVWPMVGNQVVGTR